MTEPRIPAQSPQAGERFFQWRNLSVGLTSLCNLRCKMCPVIRGEKASLTREQAFHIADFARRRNFERCVLGGGEPTILSYIWDLMDNLAESGVEMWLLTNAYRFTADYIRRLSTYPKLVLNISVDGVGDVHDGIRGQGAFESTSNAITALTNAGCRVALTTTIQRSNWRTMVEVFERFRPYPLEWHGFAYAEPFYGQEELVPSHEFDQSLQVLEEVRRRNEAQAGKAVLSKEMIRAFRIWERYPGLMMHPGKGCTIPRRQLMINERGDVRSCWHYPRWTQGATRNIHHRSLADIVDSEEFEQEVRHAIGPDGCRGCSTMCYFWDEDFRTKTMHPKGRLRVQRTAQHAREYLRLRHPWVFNAVRKAAAPLHR